MRGLQVLGVSDDGDHLVCADPTASADVSETFAIPLDERLRAAVRGEIEQFGQLEAPVESQLRPREIQRRIRAGASVAQVAAAAGHPVEKIERYAYPVLMERATTADRARAVRPLGSAALGSAQAAQADATLEEIVTTTLTDRGQLHDLHWDAFRDERGWTVTATWTAGHSENRAEWSYRPSPDGGVVTARNAEAADLIDPGPRQLRTVPNDSSDPDESAETSGAADDASPTSEQRSLVEHTVTDERAGAMPSTRDGDREQARRTGTEGPRPSSRRRNRPPMPSWEDVLLGTRSSGH